MESVILNGLEWMIKNFSRHGGTKVNGNWYYTCKQAVEAAKEVGNSWRLPTLDEIKSLCDLDSTWDDIQKGRWFGKNKELFLPALGYCDYDSAPYFATNGFYWGDLAKDDSIIGCNLYFGRGLISSVYSNSMSSLSVRLVRDIK